MSDDWVFVAALVVFVLVVVLPCYLQRPEAQPTLTLPLDAQIAARARDRVSLTYGDPDDNTRATPVRLPEPAHISNTESLPVYVSRVHDSDYGNRC